MLVFVFVLVLVRAQVLKDQDGCVKSFASEAELEEFQVTNANITWAALMLDGVDGDGES
jgi:hypothetical protein